MVDPSVLSASPNGAPGQPSRSVRLLAKDIRGQKLPSVRPAFYRKAATLHERTKKSSDLLLKLATMEDGHRQVFAGMRRELSEKEKERTAYDPDGDAVLYLQAMAEGHGGEGNSVVAGALTGKETMADILRIGIDLEKKSILFYLGLKDMVPESLGKARLDTIITEEKSHVTTLSLELQGLKEA
jgi:rubrerythrin